MADCICPVVDIKITKAEHVNESQMRTIADTLNAMVALEINGHPSIALYGKHRDDCPCGPLQTIRKVRYAPTI